MVMTFLLRARGQVGARSSVSWSPGWTADPCWLFAVVIVVVSSSSSSSSMSESASLIRQLLRRERKRMMARYRGARTQGGLEGAAEKEERRCVRACVCVCFFSPSHSREQSEILISDTRETCYREGDVTHADVISPSSRARYERTDERTGVGTEEWNVRKGRVLCSRGICSVQTLGADDVT